MDEGAGERPKVGHGAASSLHGEDLSLDVESCGEEVLIVDDEAVIRLLAEEFSVDRRRVESGRLRVRRITREHLQDIDEELERFEAEVERVPVGEIVEVRPSVRETDDEIIIPVVEEVLVVERRLMLKEEIHVRKTRHVEHHREQVTLRAQEAEIVRLPPKTSSAGS